MNRCNTWVGLRLLESIVVLSKMTDDLFYCENEMAFFDIVCVLRTANNSKVHCVRGFVKGLHFWCPSDGNKIKETVEDLRGEKVPTDPSVELLTSWTPFIAIQWNWLPLNLNLDTNDRFTDPHCNDNHCTCWSAPLTYNVLVLIKESYCLLPQSWVFDWLVTCDVICCWWLFN